MELDRIVQMYKRMGHPAMSVHGIMVDEHGRVESRGFLLLWHPPSNTVIGGDVVTKYGTKVFILTMPDGVEPNAAAKSGVRVEP